MSNFAEFLANALYPVMQLFLITLPVLNVTVLELFGGLMVTYSAFDAIAVILFGGRNE